MEITRLAIPTPNPSVIRDSHEVNSQCALTLIRYLLDWSVWLESKESARSYQGRFHRPIAAMSNFVMQLVKSRRQRSVICCLLILRDNNRLQKRLQKAHSKSIYHLFCSQITLGQLTSHFRKVTPRGFFSNLNWGSSGISLSPLEISQQPKLKGRLVSCGREGPIF